MKKIIYIIACVLVVGFSSCEDMFLDLKPLDTETDVSYFAKPEDFNEYARGFYGQLIGWQSRYGSIYDYLDGSTDLSTYFGYSADLGRGAIQVYTNDDRWNKCYENIRTINILFDKIDKYSGNKNDLKQYQSEGYFFRAYTYFYLLKFFGGVPVVTTIMDTNSPELTGPRNSRYEVVDLILSDLDKAFEGLPKEQNISSAEKGRISYYGAKAFKARVLLYEATWRRYNGTSTDYEGSAKPATDQVDTFLDEAIALCDDVMTNGQYGIWNHNGVSSMQKMSNRYLFCLEDADSNPAGLTKTSNNEFIIYSVYDKSIRPGSINLNQTLQKMDVSRKLVDMFVCTDGLPISKSARFQGYAKPGDEFKNRDNRLRSYIYEPAADVVLTDGRSGYKSAKFVATNRAAKEESANYPVLRLAEVYLTYAEALFERNGSITDEQLGRSINILRNRAGVANLTNNLVSTNELSMLEEIRRERTVELYMEGYRFDDLKRWGILEKELNPSRCGMIVGGQGYPTVFVNANGEATSRYSRNVYIWGEEKVATPFGALNAPILDSSTNHNVSKTHYLWAIPQRQIDLNPNLVQNPGYGKK